MRGEDPPPQNRTKKESSDVRARALKFGAPQDRPVHAPVAALARLARTQHLRRTPDPPDGDAAPRLTSRDKVTPRDRT